MNPNYFFKFQVVYALCIIIPCIALGAYFFGRKTVSDPKKTDEYQLDDEQNDDEEKEELLDEKDATELDDQPGPSSGSRRSSRRVG